MRVLILIIAIVVLMALVGWITFGVGPGRSSINLETEEIRQDTRQAVQSGAHALEKAGKSIRSGSSTTDDSDEVTEDSTGPK